MTSWNRRLEAAQTRPASAGARGAFSREQVLREAVAAGVGPDDQAALLALARVASERPGFRTTIGIEGTEGDLLFEVASSASGPVVRPVGDRPVGSPSPAGAATEASADRGLDVVPVLTDTLVNSPDLVAVFASVGHEAVWANDAFVTVVPIRASDGVWLVELLDEWSKGHYEVKVLPALVKFGRWRGRLTLLTGGGASGGGEPLPVSAVIVAHRDGDGEIAAVSLLARDLTEVRADAAEPGALDGETPFAALVEHVGDLIAVLDEVGTVKYASPAFGRLVGHEEGSAGIDLLDLVHPEDRPVSLADLARVDEQGLGTPVELRVRGAGDSWRHLEVVVSDLSENPVISGWVLNARDTTERVEAVRELATKAFTDTLTGLPNRMRMLDRLARALQEGEAGGSASGVAVVLVDIDHLKRANEAFGRERVDVLLVELARRVVEVAGDATVARLRSDELAVLLTGVSDPASALELATRVREAIAVPLEVDGATLSVTGSVGVALAEPGQEAEALLHAADEALDHAKRTGRDRCQLYTPEVAGGAGARREVEQRLRHALDTRGLAVHYQPVVSLPDRAVVGAEALLRVDDGGGVLLSPADYIEAAESGGLISRVGSEVLRTTCSQLAAWATLAPGTAPREVSVNVSPRQLVDPGLPAMVEQALSSVGVSPSQLSIEMTENILIGRQGTIDASIAYLRDLGVRVGLDEFGAGRSSLGHLKRFPLDFVKIDRGLVAGLGRDEQDTAIVRATIALAHNLGLTVVAVGVENEEQLEVLELLGCDRAQGYLFSAPVPAEELVTLSASSA